MPIDLKDPEVKAAIKAAVVLFTNIILKVTQKNYFILGLLKTYIYD